MIKNLYFAICLCILAFNSASLEAHMIHKKNIKKKWKEENVPPFDELMLSWNAKRPLDGKYSFYVSVKIADRWSPWLLYATWGSDGQSSFKIEAEDFPVRVYQDAFEVLEENKATGFKVKIISEGDNTLNEVYSLHVYTNSDKVQEPKPVISAKKPVHLKVQGLSQMKLNHIRYADLCSPTSTSAVVRYLLSSMDIDPVNFAQSSWDGGFDIFGNWVFNVVHASSILGPNWDCWVERLSGFDDIYKRLQQKTPVVVSIRGPIQGSAQPYSKGHLLVVTGYNPLEKRVICMDPAFSSDDQTEVSYDLSEFVQAWCRRGRVAYIFSKAQKAKFWR